MTLDDWREVIELDRTGQFLCGRETDPEVSRARQHRSAVLKGGDQLDGRLAHDAARALRRQLRIRCIKDARRNRLRSSATTTPRITGTEMAAT